MLALLTVDLCCDRVLIWAPMLLGSRRASRPARPRETAPVQTVLVLTRAPGARTEERAPRSVPGGSVRTGR